MFTQARVDALKGWVNLYGRAQNVVLDLEAPHMRRCINDDEVEWRYPHDEKCFYDGCAGVRL